MSVVGTIHPELDEPPALIFADTRPRSHWRLGLMIGVSLLGHAASFYVLQVAYTPNGSLLPPPARVVMIPLDEPEHASLARWLALTDPTLATQPPPAADETALDPSVFHYVPSYDALPPAYKPLNAVAAENIAVAPQPMPPGPVPVGLALAPKPPVPVEGRRPPAPIRSRVVLDGGLDALAPRPLPPVSFPGNPYAKPLEPTVVLVGVRPEGGTPFLFPMRQAPANNAGAGADEADEFAREYLSRLTFRPTVTPGGNALWGRATFYWGDDSLRDAKPASP